MGGRKTWQGNVSTNQQNTGLISDINKLAIRLFIRDLLPLVFLHQKEKVKKHYFIQFSLRPLIWVTIAILDAAWMTYNIDTFHHNHDQTNQILP